MKVKKVYPDAFVDSEISTFYDDFICIVWSDKLYTLQLSNELSHSEVEAWSNALTQIRKAKIKAAKDKRKLPKVVKEIKKHVGLTMYPSDKDMIVKGFGSVQKFLDSKVNEYKLTIKTK